MERAPKVGGELDAFYDVIGRVPQVHQTDRLIMDVLDGIAVVGQRFINFFRTYYGP